ncbi:hypothetical protein JCM10449v2_006444 [Rhodotorula kratochvilovae]
MSLLGWSQQVYNWFIAVHAGLKPDAAMLRHQDDVRALEASRDALPGEWPGLLPLERHAVVDRLLQAYCVMCAHGGFDIEAILHPNLLVSVGILYGVGEDAQATLDWYHRLRSTVSRIVVLYQTSVNLPGDGDKAARWANILLGSYGITVHKVARLPESALAAIDSSLAETEHRLQTFAAEGQTLPPANQALFPPDVLLVRAQTQAQPAAARFESFRSLLHSVTELYSVHNRFSFVPEAQKAAQEAEMLRAAETMLAPTAQPHYESLSLEQQVRVIITGRRELQETAHALAQYQWLPDAAQVTHTLFQPLLHPHIPVSANLHVVHEPGSAAGAPHDFDAHTPLVLESLAHAPAAGLRRISERKARRYYGTTARAWEARGAGRGW